MIKIAIFGVGLMGGSLALCFKGKPNFHVIGHSPRAESVDKYKKLEVVDEATTSMEEAAQDADFIFLGVPVGNLEEYLSRLNELDLKPGCIITDVGSTKRSICEYAAKLQWKNVYFIGGHPMTGSEQSGVEAAHAHLYENAFYVLTPEPHTPDSVYQRLVELIRHTGANIIRMEPANHDRVVGAISHLPHIIAATLVNQVAEYNEQDDLYRQLAAGGFRDFTRIASCDPIIWRDILTNNRTILLEMLEDWNRHLDRFIHLLQEADGPGIEQEFIQSNHFRNTLPEWRKGLLSSTYDLFVDVPDHPGMIGEVASKLGSASINIKNVQVMENRVDVPGILRLSFSSVQELKAAAATLEQHNYTVHM